MLRLRLLEPIIPVSVTHSNLKESALLVRHITLLEALEVSHGVLDLACGSGSGHYSCGCGFRCVTIASLSSPR